METKAKHIIKTWQIIEIFRSLETSRVFLATQAMKDTEFTKYMMGIYNSAATKDHETKNDIEVTQTL